MGRLDLAPTLQVMGTGIGLYRRGSTSWMDTSANLDGHLLGGASILIALLCYGHKRRPASLVLFGLGCVGIGWARPPLRFGAGLPFAPPPSLTWDDWLVGLYRAALPQVWSRDMECSLPSLILWMHATSATGAGDAPQRRRLHRQADRGPLPRARRRRVGAQDLSLDRADGRELVLVRPLPLVPRLRRPRRAASLRRAHRQVCHSTNF